MATERNELVAKEGYMKVSALRVKVGRNFHNDGLQAIKAAKDGSSVYPEQLEYFILDIPPSLHSPLLEMYLPHLKCARDSRPPKRYNCRSRGSAYSR
jgi:hypothetical protein